MKSEKFDWKWKFCWQIDVVKNEIFKFLFFEIINKVHPSINGMFKILH